MRFLKFTLVFLCLGSFAFAKGLSRSAEAFAVLTALATDFAQGNTFEAQKRIDPSMIGYQEFVDGLQAAKVKQKDIRIEWIDKKINEVGDRVVVIQVGWEKRFLVLPDLSAGKENGKSMFFVQKMKSEWKIVGQSGDRLFGP